MTARLQLKMGAPVSGGFAVNQHPLVTIVTIVYHGADTLEQTICSVVNQSYNAIEYIIIDGGSTDGTLDIIRKYEHALDSWISEPDGGIYDAMNKGIHLAKGEWIIFMNSGDSFAGTKVLSDLCIHLAGSTDVIYGAVEICDPDRGARVIPSREIRMPIRGLPACHQAMIIRTRWLKNKPFNLNFSLAADFDSLCHILTYGGKAVRIQPVVARVASGGVSFLNRLDVYRQYEEIHNTYFGRSLYSILYYIRYKNTERLKLLARKLVKNLFRPSADFVGQ